MGVLKNDVGRPTNKTIMIRNILKAVAVVIVVGGIILGGYFLTDYQKGKDMDAKKKVDSTTKKKEVATNDGDWKDASENGVPSSNSKIYVYNYKHIDYNGTEESYHVVTKDSSKYSGEKDYKLINTYTCNNNDCREEEENEKLNLVVIYDGKYILYDYINNKVKDINLEGINQNEVNKLLLITDMDRKKIFGYYLVNSDNKVAIYNESLSKLVTDYKYSDFYNNGKIINYKNGYIGNYYENYTVLIDFSTGEEKITEKNEEGPEYIMYEEESKEKYFVFAYGPDPGSYNIYNSNFKSVAKGVTYYSVNENGNITYNSGSKFYVIDKDGNKLYSSKNYDSDSILPVKDYVVVVDDGYLKLVSNDGKEIHKFVKLTSDMHFHIMISGWYTENKKEGIYVVVEDSNMKVSELSEKLQKEAGDNPLGYEYYYIPSTGESGKIATYIGGYAKPVLYLYPEKDNTKVTINFEKPELLTTTYPKFNNNWTVTANKNGDLHDKDGKYYYGLYWEENGSTDVTFDTGFYVTKDNAIEFLEEKLSIIGLNDRERNEFIMYWLPILEKNEKSLVYFELTSSRQKYNELKINPKPDSLLRMAIHVKKVNKKTEIKEQKLNSFERKGFTAVEWGGVIH